MLCAQAGALADGLKLEYRIDNEYIFCDDLIVAPIAVGKTGREVYLPEGKWRDFFTKEPVQCGKFTVETDSIPVYEKAE